LFLTHPMPALQDFFSKERGTTRHAWYAAVCGSDLPWSDQGKELT